MAEHTYPRLHLLVGGRRITETPRRRAVENPFTTKVIAVLPVAEPEHIEAAVDAASGALANWADRPAAERSAILRRAAVLLRERSEAVAVTMVLENGKPLAEARAELVAAAETLEWSAEEARRVYGEIIPARAGGSQFSTILQPVGVVAVFSPWNFPAVTLAKKVAPALAAGCTVVAKPDEQTPGTALCLAECLIDAGLPPGVLNIVFGVPEEISGRLIAAPAVAKLSFTGSTAVGRLVGGMAGQHLKRATMELGGHAPVIVVADADPIQAADLSVAAKFRNGGQNCTSPTRFYVHADIYEAFAARFAESAAGLKVGDGLDPASQMGPLINGRRVDEVARLVDDARGRGARILAGGDRLDGEGHLYAPTVLADPDPQSAVLHEEPFGPIAAILPYRTLDEALELANGLPYGLAGYAFTNRADVAHRISQCLRVGALGINAFAVAMAEAPFGGVGDSGYGSEGGSQGLRAFLVTKFIHHAFGTAQ